MSQASLEDIAIQVQLPTQEEIGKAFLQGEKAVVQLINGLAINIQHLVSLAQKQSEIVTTQPYEFKRYFKMGSRK
ncbi:MAG: hypothetical protein QME81_05305, partial [bacterium]|nr:hypothetical protein [bacterium]